MKVDIIHEPGTAADFKVCTRPEVGTGIYYGERYGEQKTLFGPASDSDCIDWCCENENRYRHCKFVSLVPGEYFLDLEKRCDKVHAAMLEAAKACGWSFSSDITYRASAAWKDQPTHYAYNGDFGGRAKFDGITDETANSENGTKARRMLEWLDGVASGIWELGFTLTFDKAGKHRIFGTSAQWVTLEEEEEYF